MCKFPLLSWPGLPYLMEDESPRMVLDATAAATAHWQHPPLPPPLHPHRRDDDATPGDLAERWACCLRDDNTRRRRLYRLAVPWVDHQSVDTSRPPHISSLQHGFFQGARLEMKMYTMILRNGGINFIHCLLILTYVGGREFQSNCFSYYERCLMYV